MKLTKKQLRNLILKEMNLSLNEERPTSGRIAGKPAHRGAKYGAFNFGTQVDAGNFTPIEAIDAMLRQGMVMGKANDPYAPSDKPTGDSVKFKFKNKVYDLKVVERVGEEAGVSDEEDTA